MILDDILAHKRDEVARRRQAVPSSALRDAPLYREPRRGFRAALERAQVPAVIAELKRASPSRGVIRTDYEPVAHARSYEAAGATCCSVLTDERFFQGSLAHLRAVRAAVSLLFGVLGLAMARTIGASRLFLAGGGALYLGIWLYGFVIKHESAANFLPLNNADNWLHLGLGFGMLVLGLLLSNQYGTGGRLDTPVDRP